MTPKIATSVSQPTPRSNGGYLGLLRCGQLDDVLGVAIPDGLRGTGDLLVVDDPLFRELQDGEAGRGLGVPVGERQRGDGRLNACLLYTSRCV